MTQYLLRQPESLVELAQDKLALWIALQAKKFLTTTWRIRRLDSETTADAMQSREIETIRNYLYDRLPKKLYNTLATKTIVEIVLLLKRTKGEVGAVTDVEIKVIGRIADTLFTKQLTALTVTDLFDIYKLLRYPLTNKSDSLTGLTHLDLIFDKSLFKETEIESELIALLEPLRSLKHLKIDYNCTDNILKCVDDNCKLIEDLDVSFSDRIHDGSIEIIKGMADLRRVNLNKTNVGAKGIETILLSCRNIEEIVIHKTHKCYIPFILHDIERSPHKFPKLFKITTYNSENDIFEYLKLVVDMCPLITSLYVRNCDGTISNNVMAITSLRNLRELTLDGYRFYGNNIKEVLEKVGHNLVHLNLLKILDINLRALIDISQICPKLERLSLEDCLFHDTRSVTAQELENVGAKSFQYLKTLIFLSKFNEAHVSAAAMRPRNTNPSNSPPQFPLDEYDFKHKVLFFLLSNCLKVEFVEMNKNWFTEDLMLKVLDKNPMNCLKELKLRQRERRFVNHTRVVDRIAQICQNRPQVILEIEKSTGRRTCLAVE